MTDFITSDSHFFHYGILEFEKRPFDTIEEMHEGLIKAWNSVVKKNDTVYHLGDFCFGTIHDWKSILEQLNGNIILIKGNHDKSKITKVLARDGFLKEYHPLGTLIKREGLLLHLSHYAMLLGARARNFSIHGHLHSYETGYSNHINICIDGNFAKSFGKPFGTPVEFSELLERLHKINPLIEEERRMINESQIKLPGVED